ncbi:MAG: J domain-containing protein [Deltaproteobacteria bacterium]|nr:J domain-containing protein [Deltaproteobacteria bacterium]
MGRPSKDHYATLGLSRKAGPEELRRAYRRLAQRWHPDKNPGNAAAEDRFKELSEAYSVLSDPSRRAKYDLFGFDPFPWRIDFRGVESSPLARALLRVLDGLAGIRVARDPEDELTVRVDVPVTLEEAVLGAKKKVRHNRREECARCGGTGERLRTPPPFCPRCGGSGVESMPVPIAGVEFVCRACGGAGRTPRDACLSCGGFGSRPRPTETDVAIPPGVAHGDEVRVEGKGNFVRGRGRGRLVARLAILPHPVFTPNGLDISCEVEIPFERAWKGTTVLLPGLFGLLRVMIPPGTRTGQTLRLRGKGIRTADRARAGDQFVRILVRS